jgi:hypothetical protein
MLGLVAGHSDDHSQRSMRRLAFVPIAGCLVLQSLLALIVIPPWQNPDEPQHLMSVHQVLTYGPDYRYDVLDERAERGILASMAEHRWWEHYGRPAPAPPPTSFVDGPARVVSAYFGPPDGGSRLYYRFMAIVFRIAGVRELLPQLYVMRATSLVFALLALACVWAGGRSLDPLSRVVVTALMAMQPQFVIVASSASPDAAVNLAGAFVWFQAIVLLRAPGLRVSEILGLWGGATAALLLRRVGAPLVVIAAGVTAFVTVSSRVALKSLTPVRLAALGTVVVAVLAFATMTGEGTRAVQWILRNPISMASISGIDLSTLPRFLSGLFRSFWLTAGWLRFGPPLWWISIAVGLCTVAAAGLPKALANPAIRPVVLLSVSMLAVQLLAVIGLYFVVLKTGAHGRYLFPVLPAVLLLLWIGWRAWFRSRHLAAAQLLVSTAAVMNVSGWVLVVLPAYG